MLIVRKEAEGDIRAAYEWYERQRENLGRAFLVEIDRTLEAMEDQPEAYANCFKSVRRALCRRFPYAVSFKNLAEEKEIPYQSLINLYLRDCAQSHKVLKIEWQWSVNKRLLSDRPKLRPKNGLHFGLPQSRAAHSVRLDVRT